MQEGEQRSLEESGELWTCLGMQTTSIQGAAGCPFAAGTLCLSWCLMFLREL